ncbi:hypothetical protein YC2023_024267 [Brassica napus]
MDPNQARSYCIESINLDLSRSGKPKSSKIVHDTKDQSISLQRRDCPSTLSGSPNMIDRCQDGITRVLEYAIL